MNRIYNVGYRKFVYNKSEVNAGAITDEMLQYIHQNVESYQFYSIESHLSQLGDKVYTTVNIWEKESD